MGPETEIDDRLGPVAFDRARAQIDDLRGLMVGSTASAVIVGVRGWRWRGRRCCVAVLGALG